MESAVLFMLIIFLAFFLFMWIRQLIIPEKENKSILIKLPLLCPKNINIRALQRKINA